MASISLNLSPTRTSCSYCHLPIPGLRPSAIQPNSRYFCCAGCRLAADLQDAYAADRPLQSLQARIGLAVFCTMNVLVFSMALWSHDVYAHSPSQASLIWRQLLQYGAMLFSLPVLMLLGQPMLLSAWESAQRGQVVADQLLSVGVLVAFFHSAISVLLGLNHIYFEIGCVILVAVTIGHLLEATGKHKATTALEQLQHLLPASARRQTPQGEVSVTLQEVELDDVLRVLPGERIPLDGVLLSSSTVVDEQIISGETFRVTKVAGELVIGGSLNLSQEILVRTRARLSESTVHRIAQMVRSAALEKGPQQQLADRLVTWFVPAVIVVCIVTFIYHHRHGTFASAWMTAMAVVLISCPCALGVATPLAAWSALCHAARRGILVRSIKSLEELAKAKVVFFDKTGTLTLGEPRCVGSSMSPNADRHALVRIAQRLASASNHPLATSLRNALNSVDTPIAGGADVREEPGQGLVAEIPDYGLCCLGSSRFARAHGFEIPPVIEDELRSEERISQAVVLVGWNQQVRGAYWFDDELHAAAKPTIDSLKACGIHPVLLTGDRAERGAWIGVQLGIEAHGGLLPQDKQEKIQKQRQEKTVVMVGDGINDAPSMAAADVGIAMGTGADLTREAAGICLLRNDLQQIPWLIRHAQRTLSTIRRNLVWAFAYNLIGILIAAAGYLNPILAAVAMTGSSLFVIVDSLRLLTYDR